MNRVVNIFTFLLLGIFCLMVMTVVLDLSISQLHLKGMPYKQQIFTGFAVVILLLGLVRVKRRWQGMRDMKKYSKFQFTAPVAQKHRTHGVAMTLIEVVFILAGVAVCSLFLNLEPNYVIPMIVVLCFLALESLVFAVVLRKGGKAFILGIDDAVIACFDREMHLFYYTGLERVELHQKDLINFGYREDLDIGFETSVINESDRKLFRDALINKLESKKVYVDDSLRNWE